MSTAEKNANENGSPPSTDGDAAEQNGANNKEVLYKLVPKTLSLLKTLQTSTHLSDTTYLSCQELLYTLHEFNRIHRVRLTDLLLNPKTSLPSLSPPQSLSELSTLLSTTLSDLLAKTKPLPRVLRLASRLSFSEAETRAFIFIIFHCVGVSPEDGGWHIGRSTLQKWKDWAGLSTAEMLEFLSPHRQHFKSGLIDACEEFAANYGETSFRVPRTALKALYGAEMQVEEVLSLEGTALADILKEEDGWKGEFEKVEENVTAETNGTVDEVIKELGGDLGEAPFLEKLRFISSKRRELEEKNEEEVNGVKDKTEGGEEDGKDVKEEVDTEKDEGKLTPYTTDLDYLQQGFQVVVERVRIYNLNEKEEEPFLSNKRNRESLMRELEAKERQALSRFHRRLALTRSQKKSWLPRLEQLVDLLSLNEFERFVMLCAVGVVLSQEVSRAYRALPRYRRQFDISMLLSMNCANLEEEIHSRKYFYPDSKLCSSGLVRPFEPVSRRKNSSLSDLASITVEVDRRMLDYVSGLDTELNDLLSFVRCYKPTEKLDQVVLPKDTKKLVVETAENFETFKRFRRDVGFDDIVKYGKGLVALFYGPPGTGKTLFANALACHLGKKILTVQFAMLEQSWLDAEGFGVLFREAAIQDAIIFFDECESLFEARHGGRMSTSVALKEIESYDGFIILTTNEPKALDHAMHRRISLAVEFHPPDPTLRREIWLKHIPEKLKLAEDVDYTALAIEHELTGGFIKNAILQAMSMAIIQAREKKGSEPEMGEIEVEMSMLREACRLQSRGRLRMTDLQRRVIPKRSFTDLVLPEDALVKLRDCVMSEKVRGILASQWGFKNDEEEGRANIVLVHGPSGCGMSSTALAVGFEVGKPVQLFSASEVLRRDSEDIHELFADAAVSDSIIVIEDVELLFGSLSKLGESSANETLYHIASYQGLVVLCCRTSTKVGVAGWPRFVPFPQMALRLIRYVVEIPSPNEEARRLLWTKAFPKETPREEGLEKNLNKIAKDYRFSGATISSCARRAASMAAIRGVEGKKEEARVTIEDIEEACEMEVKIVKMAERESAQVAFA